MFYYDAVNTIPYVKSPRRLIGANQTDQIYKRIEHFPPCQITFSNLSNLCPSLNNSYSANIYEYITKDAELQKVDTTYNINSPALDDRFNGDWNAFMTFSRKNRSWANIIERAEYAYAS